MTVAPGHRQLDTTDLQMILPGAHEAPQMRQGDLGVAAPDDRVEVRPGLAHGLAAVLILRTTSRAEEDRIRAALGVPARTTKRKRRRHDTRGGLRSPPGTPSHRPPRHIYLRTPK
jgi:hypothetical protein